MHQATNWVGPERTAGGRDAPLPLGELALLCSQDLCDPAARAVPLVAANGVDRSDVDLRVDHSLHVSALASLAIGRQPDASVGPGDLHSVQPTPATTFDRRSVGSAR